MRDGLLLLPGDELLLFPWADLGSADGTDVVRYHRDAPLPDDVVARVEVAVLPNLLIPADLALLQRMPRLVDVQTLSAGYDQMWAALPSGVRLHNASGVHDASTAELAVTLVLASRRRVPDFVRAQRDGVWSQGPADGLADARVLILGYGSIGAAIERRLAGFEVDIVRVAAHARTDEGRRVHAVHDLPQLLPAVDVVIVIVRLDDSTRGLVDADFLALLPDGALVVNVARGPVIDTDALLDELRRGRLQAALDVTDPEPLPPDHPLWSEPGVLVTPHVGGYTRAFAPRARALVLGQLRRWRAGEPLAHEVHPPR